MILVDALFINNGGGKILLDYLIKYVESTELKVFYLLDSRVKNKVQNIKSTNEIAFLDASFINRYSFYFRNKRKYKVVFCFGNIPPFCKYDAKVLTYFHNLLYIDRPSDLTFINRFKLSLKIAILRKTKNNTSYWLVQSKFIKHKLERNLNISTSQIKVLPFYDDYKYNLNVVNREKDTFIYVSNGEPHKNHILLIMAFCKFFDLTKKGKLILTINFDYPKILELISQKVNIGYPIENIGFVNREMLQLYYFKSEYLIFPSLTESFGLGIIEAIECGCKVIGADLPYTYEVCEPSYIFNPIDINSIYIAFDYCVSNEIKISTPKIRNNITEIANLLLDYYAIN